MNQLSPVLGTATPAPEAKSVTDRRYYQRRSEGVNSASPTGCEARQPDAACARLSRSGPARGWRQCVQSSGTTGTRLSLTGIIFPHPGFSFKPSPLVRHILSVHVNPQQHPSLDVSWGGKTNL